MNANQVVAFIVRRRFVGEDVPPHQVAHDQVFGSSGNHGKSKWGLVAFGHQRVPPTLRATFHYIFRISKLNRPEPPARGKLPDAVQF
jgi:hypothetical protein